MKRDINKLFDESQGDLTFRNDDLGKAENLLSVHLGKLYYLANFGINFEYFIESTIQFQLDTFKNYIVKRFSENFLTISNIDELFANFFTEYNISISAETNKLPEENE